MSDTGANEPKKGGWLDDVDGYIKKIHSIIISLTALVTAIVGLLIAIPSYRISGESIKQSANTAATLGEQLDSTRGSAPPSNTIAVPSPSGPNNPQFVVQLATYLFKNCSIAKEEIAGYGRAFDPLNATLWRDQNGQGRYIIVGIKAENAAAANGARGKAIALAESSAQAGNDLASARVRTAPAWVPITACPSQ